MTMINISIKSCFYCCQPLVATYLQAMKAKILFKKIVNIKKAANI